MGVNAWAEELRTRGAEVLDGPEDRRYGQREVVVKDCNGLILCFGEDTSGCAASQGRPEGMNSETRSVYFSQHQIGALALLHNRLT